METGRQGTIAFYRSRDQDELPLRVRVGVYYGNP
jgi:hypothetical protein